MMRKHFLFCLVGVSACFVVGTLATKAIIDGRRAKVDQFPYQVSVQSTGYYKGHICGGGIISENHILTAAHCVLRANRRFRGNPICIVAGTNDMGKAGEPGVVTQVKKIYIPTDYSPPRTLTGDIAVLKLVRSLEMSKHRNLKALTLPRVKREGETVHDDKTALIAGWGWHWIDIEGEKENGGRYDSTLRYGEADIISTSKCQNDYPSRNLTRTELCARVKQSLTHTKIRGVCEGDGGGPLVYNLTVIGVLSVTPYNCSERNAAVIYTRVSNYLTFIDNALKNNPSKKMRELILDT